MIISTNVLLTEIECWSCGLNFAVSVAWDRKRQEDGKGFRCPAGCSIYYGDTEVTRLQRQLNYARDAQDRLARQRDRAEHRASAYKGQATKLKKRVVGGACPCCNRTFVELQRHIAKKHPEFVEQVDE